MLLLLTTQQNFGLDQIESTSRQQINVAKMMISVINIVCKIVGKGEMVVTGIFFISPRFFFSQKISVSVSLKLGTLL